MTDSNKMYCSSRIQVVVILFLVTFAAAVAISTPTYEWTDESGMTVMCQKCPPGTYVAKHCSSKHQTVCQVCPDEHYTQYWHYLDKCRFCNVICQEGEQVKDKCNSTHNRVCECQPGYHHNGHYCVKDLQCNFQDAVQDEDEACDKLVIDFILKLNISTATLQRLEFKINNHKGRKPISQRRIRNLLREFKNRDPGLPLLPRLLVFLQEAKISGLEKKLRKKFLLKEES
ncbi:tumor necrosis factor receptor superfamily member 6B isoform X2 [Hyla sarda]|uniref:tumor necrosis factor receptor superfamily member 6B isoform X2 n=1 Tax=Hyla sarda TaxID=327740 RepID=UPI0024C3C6BD|nr:tumor necrosis factor receptor superfamily member 6B isoform X2 [Hyla sarda]